MSYGNWHPDLIDREPEAGEDRYQAETYAAILRLPMPVLDLIRTAAESDDPAFRELADRIAAECGMPARDL